MIGGSLPLSRAEAPEIEQQDVERAVALQLTRGLQTGPQGLPLFQFPEMVPRHRQGPAPALHSPVPPADVVVITWTTAEHVAQHYVLANDLYPLPQSPGHNKLWEAKWHSYARGLHVTGKRGVWGTYCEITIGSKRVLLIKSELHLNQDGLSLPLTRFIEQILEECRPSLVLSVGTAGGVRPGDILGDVVVSNAARFRLSDEFVGHPDNHQIFASSWQPPDRYLEAANALLMEVSELPVRPITAHYPADTVIEPRPPRRPQILLVPDIPILTTDYFEFGTTRNDLHNYGCCVEMDDAVIGMVCSRWPNPVPFGFVRNLSDAVINGDLPPEVQAAWAVKTYKLKGLYTSFNGAIATWAMIAGMP